MPRSPSNRTTLYPRNSIVRVGHPEPDFMARYDFRTPRLFTAAPLGAVATVTLDAAQVHYLVNVLRMTPGDPVLIFNGADGEWKARLTAPGKRNAALAIEAQTRPQPRPGN